MVNPESKLLLDESPLIVLRGLAKLIGLQEAIFLQQLHYWLIMSPHEYDGRKWIKNTYDQWTKQISLWSFGSTRKIVYALEQQDIIISTNVFNKNKTDKTKWYTIHYEMLNRYVLGSQPPQESAVDVLNSNTSNGQILTQPSAKIEQCSNKNTDKNIIKENIGDDIYLTLIPISLASLEGFNTAWTEWNLFRKEIKKPLKPTTVKQQLRFLEKQKDPIEIIQQSIRNGWQGLFPIKSHSKMQTGTYQFDPKKYQSIGQGE